MKKRQPVLIFIKKTIKTSSTSIFKTFSLFLLTQFYFSTSSAQNVLYTRTIGQTQHCNGVTTYSFYLNLDGATSEEKLYQMENGQMIEYDDGTATITGVAINNVHPAQKWDIDVVMTGRTFTKPESSPKLHECNPTVIDDWYYYTATSGTFTGLEEFEGALISISRRGPAFQIGTGANVQEIDTKFDGCGWHFLTFESQPNSGVTLSGLDGDFNFPITGNPMTPEESCNGNIGSFRFIDGTDVIPIRGGDVFMESEIPSTAQLRAMVTGHSSSIAMNVSGEQYTQNTPPYIMDWNKGPGTYFISGQIYSEENLEGVSCDQRIISITIIPDTIPTPDVLLDLGGDANLCSDDTLIITPTISNPSDCYIDCTPSNSQLIAQYDMNACSSFEYNNSNRDFSELISTTTNSPCASISSSPIYKFEGKHSCTDDSQTNIEGDALCIEAGDTLSYLVTNKNSLLFDILMTPENGVAALDNISFQVLAPELYKWSAEGHTPQTGPNNYPQSYALQVYKNGIVIYEATGLPLSQNWNIQNFNFESNPDFIITEQTTFTFALLAYDRIENGAEVSVWDIDDIQIYGACCTPDVYNEVSYLWSDNSTNPTLEASAPGLYGLTITDCSGRTATDEINITQNVPVLDLTAINPTCNGEENGSISFTQSGGTLPYTFEWSNGNTSDEVLSNLGAGTYTLTLSDDNACSTSAEITLNQNDSLLVNAIIIDNYCFGENEGSIELAVSGGDNSYSYLWSNGATTQLLNNLAAGNYTVTVTDGQACEVVDTFTITEANELFSSISASSPACANEASGTATIDVTGGSGNYTYSWSNGDSTPTTTQLATGIYQVSVWDENNCLHVDEIEITATPAIEISIEVLAENLCYGEANASLQAVASGGTGSFTFLWNNGETTDLIDSLTAGAYTVEVMDDNACISTQTIVIEEPTPFTTTLTDSIMVACAGDTSGSVIILAEGGTAPYTFSWSNGETTQNLSGLGAGIYTLTATDANNCTSNLEVIISEATSLSINNVSIQTEQCANDSTGSINVEVEGGTAPYTFSWSNGSSSQNLNGIGNGIYDLEISDQAGCTFSESFTVDGPQAIVLDSISVDNITNCYQSSDASIYARATGGTGVLTYTWSTGQTGQLIELLSAGTYQLSVSDENDCVLIENITIQEPEELTLNLSSVPPSCNTGNDGSITSTISGGTAPYTYEWSNSNTNADLENLEAGTYSLTVTDANACTQTADVTLEQAISFTLEISSQESPSCFEGEDGSVEILINSGQAPFSYLWNDNVTVLNRGDLSAGIYSLEVSDANGCTELLEINVEEPSALNVEYASNNLSCYGSDDGSIDLTITGGTAPYTVDWNTGDTLSSISNLAAGTYTAIITDFNGCSTIVEIEILENEALSLSATLQAPTCHDAEDGMIVLEVFGGTGQHDFVWSNGNTAISNEGLSAGIYTVEIRDSAQCVLVDTFSLVAPDAVRIAFPTVLHNNCYGDSTGSILATITGGSGNYTYSWNQGMFTTKDISNLPTGSYTLQAIDENACMSEATVFIEQADEMTVNLSASNPPSCNGALDGSISIQVSGGTGAYSYLWSTGAITSTLSNVGAGEYSVLIQDSLNCEISFSTILEEPAPLTVEFTDIVTNACFYDLDASVTAVPSGGTPPYTYLWSNGETSATIDSLSEYYHDITITDSEGCSVIGHVDIDSPIYVQLPVNPENVSCHGANDGSIFFPSAIFALEFTFEWADGSTSNQRENLAPGQYELAAFFGNGCRQDISFEITEPAPFELSTIVEDVTCNGGSDGSIQVAADGGTAPYTFAWNDGENGDTRQGLGAGNYILTLSDANSCTYIDTIEIIEPQYAVTPYLIYATAPSCYNYTDGSIDISVAGGIAPYTYQWNDAALSTTEDLQGLLAGEYTVIVTDATGCTGTLTKTLIQPELLEVEIFEVEQTTCYGGTDGKATAFASGGNAPYTYAWRSGETTPRAEMLSPGYHIVTVHDATGCINLASMTLAETPPIQAVGTGSEVSCLTSNEGTVSVDGLGGQAPYTAQWSNGASGLFVDSLSAGTYIATLTDANGCTGIGEATVIDTSNILDFYMEDDIICEGFEFEFMAIDMPGAINYSWNIFVGNRDQSSYLTSKEGQVMYHDFDAGEYYIQLFADLDNGCEIMMDSVVNVTSMFESPCEDLEDGMDVFNVTARMTADLQAKIQFEIYGEEPDIFFEIERSLDNLISWESVGSMPGTMQSLYLFLHDNPKHGLSYYRIKVVQQGGVVTISDPVSLYRETLAVEGFTYPNPATTSTYLELTEPLAEDTRMELWDGNGNQLIVKMVAAGTSQVFWDLSNLPVGQYSINSVSNGRMIFIDYVVKITN